MDLEIIVVSYNTCQLTTNCLDSVYRALDGSRLEAHVWVVDNASVDDSADLVHARFPQATLVASADNLGFAGGTNLALARIAAGSPPRHVLLLNPDTLVAEGALEALVAFLDTHPRVGGAGAQLLYGDGSFQHGAFHFPTLPMAFFDFWTINHRLINSWLNGRYPRRRYAAGVPFPIDHPLGAALMARWEMIVQIGPLDTDYFMYCEEIDWCLRAKAAGWEIYCVPQAQITHLAGQSTRQFRDAMFVALWHSRYRLFAKHYSRAYQFLVRIIVRAGLRRLLRDVQRAVRQGTLLPEEAARRSAAYHQVMEM
jgi:N-acetylglucosaminyl-diphospho-decaprenol L-rhamnosyltransferase